MNDCIIFKTREDIAAELRARYTPYKRQGNSAKVLAEELGVSHVAARLVMARMRLPSDAMLVALGYSTTPYYRKVPR